MVRMNKRQTNFMKRHLSDMRYGIWRRYPHLDWAKPCDDSLYDVALAFYKKLKPYIKNLKER